MVTLSPLVVISIIAFKVHFFIAKVKIIIQGSFIEVEDCLLEQNITKSLYLRNCILLLTYGDKVARMVAVIERRL